MKNRKFRWVYIYMTNDIVNKYKYDKSLFYYSDKYYYDDINIFISVKNKQDVERKLSIAKTTFSTIQRPLDDFKITQIERAVARYEIAISKVLQNINQFSYTAIELQELIDYIFIFHKQVEELNNY